MSIIYFIFGITLIILNIIFFFKMWFMTNNVKKITSQFVPPYSKRTNLIKMLNNPVITKDNITSLLYHSLFDEAYVAYNDNNVSVSWYAVKEYYKKLYDTYKIEYPSILQLENISDFRKFM